MPCEPQSNNSERQVHMMAAALARTRGVATDLHSFNGEHHRVNFEFTDDIPKLTKLMYACFEHNPHMAYENVIIGTSVKGREHGYISFYAFPGYLPYQPGQPRWTWDARKLHDYACGIARISVPLSVTQHHAC